MALTVDFQDCEVDPSMRVGPLVERTMLVWHRTYSIAMLPPTAFWPKPGDVVSLRGVQAVTLTSGTNLIRVLHVGTRDTPIHKSRPGTKYPYPVASEQHLAISFYLPRFRAATPVQYSELAFDQQLTETTTSYAATRIFVSTDGTTGVPARGDLWPNDTGLLGRRVKRIGDSEVEMPGLHYHHVSYDADVAFTLG